MTYEAFLKLVPTMLQEEMGEEAQVSLHTIYKNNNQKREALCILEPGCNVSPTIYMAPYYERYQEGGKMGEILEAILAEYRTNRCGLYLDVGEFQDFDKLRSRIVYKLVNYEQNQPLLQDIPHRRFLDLAVVYYFLIQNHFIGSGTAMVHNRQLEAWGVDEGILYETARENTDRLLGNELEPMPQVIQELLRKDLVRQVSQYPTREDYSEEQLSLWASQILSALMPKEKYVMYVLSNRDKYFGASAVLNQKKLTAFASEHGNFYVIPSSIHEMILMPECEPLSAVELKRLLEEINTDGQIVGQEYLSSRIYYFDKEKDCLE